MTLLLLLLPPLLLFAVAIIPHSIPQYIDLILVSWNPLLLKKNLASKEGVELDECVMFKSLLFAAVVATAALTVLFYGCVWSSYSCYHVIYHVIV